MALSDILASIDSEIAQLQKARALLTGASAPAAKKKPGRPRKIAAEVVSAAAKPAKAGRGKRLFCEDLWLGGKPFRFAAQDIDFMGTV